MPNRQRDEVVEGVAWGQYERSNPLGMVGNHMLCHCTPRVIGDEHDAVEIRSRKEAVDHLGNSRKRKVGAVPHFEGMRSQRPVGCDAAVIPCQILDHTTPHVAVGDDAVQEHDGRTRARDPILDRTLWNLNDAAFAEHSRNGHTRPSLCHCELHQTRGAKPATPCGAGACATQ